MVEKVKEYLTKDNSIIVFDTNVFLNLYEYSPHVSEFFIELISYIKDKVVVISTVKREFYRNHKNCYHRQKKKFENVPHQLKKSTESTKTKLIKQIDIWEKFKFPNIESFRNLIEERLTGLETAFDEYVEENDIFQEINDNFLNEDKILHLMEELIKSDKLMKEVSVDEIYEICEKGKNRYKSKTPPGFMDDKDKDGVDKYNDLIIWSEVIKYCKEKSVDLIFVTDDLKDDWWINNDSMKFEFHPQLVQEFEKETNIKLYFYTAVLYNLECCILIAV
ncbi:PIN domain-containing protein [Bacillaceae bacterium S4-13-58]